MRRLKRCFWLLFFERVLGDKFCYLARRRKRPNRRGFESNLRFCLRFKFVFTFLRIDFRLKFTGNFVFKFEF